MYHPMQRNNIPSRGTVTPKPTSTITPTPENTPTAFSTIPSPTAIPWSPSPTPPTPVPTYTPMPFYYDVDSVAWRLRGPNGNPHYIGVVDDPQQEPPRYYDWHLTDHDQTNPSECFDKGGLFLNPGSTQQNSSGDSGFVDLGRHVVSSVPPVNSFGVSMDNYIYHMNWSKPLYWSDGSIFHQSDIGGYVILYGHEDARGFGGNFGGAGTIESIGQPIFLSSGCSTYETGFLPVGTTHFGVYLYDIQGMDSPITWQPKPVLGK